METKIEVQFKVEGQHITPENNVTITSGSRNYYYAVFEFDDVWLGLNPKAAFAVGKKSYIIPLDNTQGKHECKIPWEVIARDAGFYVGVFGGDSLRSDTTFVGVIKGTQVDGDTAQPPTPDWYNQIEQRVNDAVSAATEVQQRADSGEFNGKKGDPGRTPVKGVDYFTESEITEFKKAVTPQKGVDYFDGKEGHTPVKGVDYFDGEPGYTPQKGVDYFDGEKGDPFRYEDFTPEQLKSLKGEPGKPGYTPQKGVDYWTDTDKAEMVQDVLNALPTAEGGAY